jgi:hypothetical protein
MCGDQDPIPQREMFQLKGLEKRVVQHERIL